MQEQPQPSDPFRGSAENGVEPGVDGPGREEPHADETCLGGSGVDEVDADDPGRSEIADVGGAVAYTGAEHDADFEVESDAAGDDIEAVSVDRPDDPSPSYESTGRPDVDAVLDRLADLDGVPPSDHVDVYEDVHRRLHETLVAAAEGSEPGANAS